MRISLRARFIVTTVVALLLSLIAVLAYLQLFFSIRGIKTVFAALETKIALAEKERKSSRLDSTLLETRAEDLKRINNFLIDRENPLPFIEAVEMLAKNTQNRLSLDFAETESKQEGIAFRLTTEGSEPNVLRFLSLLEVMPYDIEIRDVIFQRTYTESKNIQAVLLTVLISAETK